MRHFCFKVITLLVLATSLTLLLNAKPAYYRHHYVIVVDQGVIQKHSNTRQLYKEIKDLFVNNKSFGQSCATGAIPHFNDSLDQISIFASGISDADYMRFFQQCQANTIDRNTIASSVADHLFHPIKDFRSSGASLSGFLDKSLKPLMNAQWRSKNLSTFRIGLNEYLYPLVLYKLDAEIPSENYYFIIVSNFTAQGAIHTVLEQQVRPLLGNKNLYISEFESDIARWRCYFYENDFATGYTTHLVKNDTEHNADAINNEPKINYFKLGIKSLEGVGLSIKTSPQFTQQNLHGERFKNTDVEIVFNHPEDLKIENVWAEYHTNDADDLKEYELGKDVKSQRIGDVHIYQFKNKNNIKLGTLRPSDKVDTKYFFSAIINKADDTPLLPMIFSASCTYEMRSNDFVPTMPLWTKILIMIVVLCLVLGALFFVWRKRGEKVTAELENVRFVPVSRERFMDVSDMKVKEYDCWYMDPQTPGRTQVALQVRGTLNIPKQSFAQDIYRVRLEFKVEDIDYDDNFTFRPRGRDQNGTDYQISNWYLVNVNNNGEFTIPIIAYLDTEEHPELRNLDDEFWQEDHILKTQVDFRALLVRKQDKVTLTASKLDSTLTATEIWSTHPIQIYEFIARPTFNLRDSWIAFDPGTSGACAAFITGGNIDTPDNIHIVHELVSYSGKEVYEPIFPSKIWITDYAQAFKKMESGKEITEVGAWEECADERDHKDFLFGWRAYRLIVKNSFQSIKKLLGYTNTQSIINREGKVLQIRGKLLAQLLVKGLYAHTQRYILDLYNNPDKFIERVPHPADPIDIRNQYLDNEQFAPQKAIVAVPNNYTLPKIQDMVDTVKALGQFKEVHYLYESEGILMEYCHQKWHQLDTKQDKLIVVFDMGGATINATAFKLTKVTKDQHDNITDIVINTVGKIGYCVGGDDIDYAIIKQIYAISFIKELYKNKETLRKQHMATHKQLLIKLARELKLSIIAKYNNISGGVLDSPEGFLNHLLSYSKDMGWPEEDVKLNKNDEKTWMDSEHLCKSSKILQDLVYSKIKDSVQELFASMNKEYQTLPIEIIFGGRSTLFPFVRETVTGVLPGSYAIWKGLEKNGTMDANAVKTAVASGACWYANFSQHITIQHNILTTAFGYLDFKGGQEIFVPMIQAGEKFKNGIIKKCVEPYSAALLQEVVFVQMQGANHAKILEDFRKSNEQKHKMNILDKVKTESDVTNIEISLDERFNFSYEITTANDVEEITPQNYPFSRLSLGAGVKTEIADENNESYMFAAISSQEEIKEQQKTIENASISTKTNKRF